VKIFELGDSCENTGIGSQFLELRVLKSINIIVGSLSICLTLCIVIYLSVCIDWYSFKVFGFRFMIDLLRVFFNWDLWVV